MKVTALLAVTDPVARKRIKQALQSVVSATLIEVDSPQSLHHAVTFNDIDLIIVGATMGQASCDIIEQIRFGRLHAHPFPVIIHLVDHWIGSHHQKLIDSGADLVLSTASAVCGMGVAVRTLAQGRRLFVVSHHYVGPDRRETPRADQTQADLLVPPNPLAARLGATGEAEFRREISVAMHRISLIRQRLYTISPAIPPLNTLTAPRNRSV